MAQVSNIVTLGIGPESTIGHFLRSGLETVVVNSNIITLGIGGTNATIGHFLTSGLGNYSAATDWVHLTLLDRDYTLTIYSRLEMMT